MNKKFVLFLRQLLIIFILFCPFSKAQAQTITPKEIENDLSESYEKIFPFYYDNHDSLEFYSSLFSSKINSYISKYPSTLSYSFKKLTDSNQCTIATSKDSLFRIYSWDTWLGGTMHDFENIFQYKSGNKIYAISGKSHDDYGAFGFFSDIFTLIANNKTYYLAINNSILSTKDINQSIQIFAIENGKLNDTVKLIKTSTHLTYSINLGFDFFKVEDNGERPIRVIKYDEEKKIIYIPIVLEDGTVTKRFILYKFNGKYFEKIIAQKANQNK